MTIRVSTAGRNGALAVINDLVNAGSGAGQIKMYSGSQPASPNSPATGTLLATFTLADPAFEAPADGSIAVDASPDLSTTATASGTAGWLRFMDSTGTAVLDGTVGTNDEDFTVNTTSIVNGQTVILTDALIVFPA